MSILERHQANCPRSTAKNMDIATAWRAAVISRKAQFVDAADTVEVRAILEVKMELEDAAEVVDSGVVVVVDATGSDVDVKEAVKAGVPV